MWMPFAPRAKMTRSDHHDMLACARQDLQFQGDVLVDKLCALTQTSDVALHENSKRVTNLPAAHNSIERRLFDGRKTMQTDNTDMQPLDAT